MWCKGWRDRLSFLLKVIFVAYGFVVLLVFLLEGDMCGVGVGGTVGLSY